MKKQWQQSSWSAGRGAHSQQQQLADDVDDVDGTQLTRSNRCSSCSSRFSANARIVGWLAGRLTDSATDRPVLLAAATHTQA